MRDLFLTKLLCVLFFVSMGYLAQGANLCTDGCTPSAKTIYLTLRSFYSTGDVYLQRPSQRPLSQKPLSNFRTFSRDLWVPLPEKVSRIQIEVTEGCLDLRDLRVTYKDDRFRNSQWKDVRESAYPHPVLYSLCKGDKINWQIDTPEASLPTIEGKVDGDDPSSLRITAHYLKCSKKCRSFLDDDLSRACSHCKVKKVRIRNIAPTTEEHPKRVINGFNLSGLSRAPGNIGIALAETEGCITIDAVHLSKRRPSLIPISSGLSHLRPPMQNLLSSPITVCGKKVPFANEVSIPFPNLKEIGRTKLWFTVEDIKTTIRVPFEFQLNCSNICGSTR